jgi:hypothetical protein
MASRNATGQWGDVSHVIPELLPVARATLLEQFWYTSCHDSRKFPAPLSGDPRTDQELVEPHDS